MAKLAHWINRMKDLCKIQAGPERESPHLMPGPLETTCLMACREEVFSSRSDTGRSCSVEDRNYLPSGLLLSFPRRPGRNEEPWS